MKLQDCLREFLYHVCVFKFQPVLIRISTVDNHIADFISRNHDTDSIEKMFESKGIAGMKPIVVDDIMFDLVGNW